MNSPVAGIKPGTAKPAGNVPAVQGQELDPLDRLKALLDPSHWDLLQNLLNWAIMWENTRQGLVTPYNEQTQKVMLGPWNFFNAHPLAAKNLSQYCTGAFMSAYGQYEADAIYRKANPMPWIVLQVIAPAFAACCTNSQEGSKAAWEIIIELRKIDELPIEPDSKPTIPQSASVESATGSV